MRLVENEEPSFVGCYEISFFVFLLLLNYDRLLIYVFLSTELLVSAFWVEQSLGLLKIAG